MEINGQKLNSTAQRIAEKIRCLQKKKGFCFATNAQLAGMMNLSAGYISHELTYLERAGKIYRLVERDDRGEVTCRKLYAFKHTEETALAAGKVEEMMKDESENGQRRRLCANGANVGIAPTRIIKAILQFGIEKVDEALSIVKASTSVRNPMKLLYKALYEGWKAGKRAQAYRNTVFTGAKRRIITEVRDAKAEKIEYVIDQSDFAKSEYRADLADRKSKLQALKAQLKRKC